MAVKCTSSSSTLTVGRSPSDLSLTDLVHAPAFLLNPNPLVFNLTPCVPHNPLPPSEVLCCHGILFDVTLFF
ncbi:Uncharacterized protein DAT39_005576 [Clarias magur]|uniref:Uncharacterized protein n=1 Tax=Clarias magur TaxID=1594786 RepID=A0A8J4UQX3_CLAMG|nr:Uncharacterized protein DAT39_005576 [Clarias magur]